MKKKTKKKQHPLYIVVQEGKPGQLSSVVKVIKDLNNLIKYTNELYKKGVDTHHSVYRIDGTKAKFDYYIPPSK